MKNILRILCSTITIVVLFLPVVTSAKSGAVIDLEVDETIGTFKEAVKAVRFFWIRPLVY